MTVRGCLKSMRLRTLPLSLSGVIVGIATEVSNYETDTASVIFLLLTTVFLQILSNLSNELGDILHGTDRDDRQGIRYAVQDGEMTVTELKRLVMGAALCSCVAGTLMIFFSFGTLLGAEPLLFLVLGAAAVTAAMRYTLGRNPYGYRGLGDLYVFLFFGMASTLGAYYICSHSLDFSMVILPAAAIGLFSIGVLNVNNIRDMKTDVRTRTTLALKLGARGARIYQTVLISSGWTLLIIHSSLFAATSEEWLYLAMLPMFIFHLKGVWTTEDRDLDPMLPLLVLSTFATALIFSAAL